MKPRGGLGLCAFLLLTACGPDPARPDGLTLPPDSDTTFRRDTGGPLRPDQAAFDVQHYDLALQVLPEEREIHGQLSARFKAVEELEQVVLDLDPALRVAAVVAADGVELAFRHQQGLLFIELPAAVAAGAVFELTIDYGGVPRSAPRPPWEGGFQWERTPSGEHWIATSCQMEGADLWWPCKDHPSDKAESMDLHIRVPAPLVVASNGRAAGVDEHDDGTRTFHWQVTTPIANYCVALNIAPYVEVSAPFTSIGGEAMKVTFWALPQHREQAAGILPQFLDHLAWFEQRLGPYPFRADKYGIAETPHLGMEHQSIIAYGNRFQPHKFEYDWLHHHELSHEWFANLVTAPDWNDFWIHEGFGSYMQKLYIEELRGRDAYREYLGDVRGQILNAKAVAPREPRSSGQMYFVSLDAPVGQRVSDNDIYYKGEWVLHTLRWLIGDQAMFRALRLMCYPTVESEWATDGSASHFMTTDDVQALFERESGMDLGWFFELYLRQPQLPELKIVRESGRLLVEWLVPDGQVCLLPVEVFISGSPYRLELPGGRGELQLPASASFVVDPFDRVLRVGNLK